MCANSRLGTVLDYVCLSIYLCEIGIISLIFQRRKPRFREVYLT